jgi:predicted ATP-grasp superfamily ATP-dependent carboligase
LLERTDNPIAVVLGGHVNGYSVLQELLDFGIKNIWLIDSKKNPGSYSRLLSGFTLIDENSTSLYKALKNLSKEYSFLVPFATNDYYLEWLQQINSKISEFCFIPFNAEKLDLNLSKAFQYQICKELEIPFPNTITLTKATDVNKLNDLNFPIIIKPIKREDILGEIFRNKVLRKFEDLKKIEQKIDTFLKAGIELIASEIVPGDDTNIYAYTAHKNINGEIINSWIGKKLNQYPDNYGVFSSATNRAPEIIRYQGEKLVKSISTYGIIEPEFKFDVRDNTYKLMEINLRSMMWHRIGYLCGVPLNYSLWREALNMSPKFYEQNTAINYHFVYLKHELINLIYRKKYLKSFVNNLYKGNHRSYAYLNKSDLKPFLVDQFFTLKTIISRWLNR